MELLNLKQAARYIGKSPSTLRRLMDAGRVGFYGLAHEQKTFSPAKHLDPYLRSIETVPKKAKAKKSLPAARKRATDLFENLRV